MPCLEMLRSGTGCVSVHQSMSLFQLHAVHGQCGLCSVACTVWTPNPFWSVHDHNIPALDHNAASSLFQLAPIRDRTTPLFLQEQTSFLV